MVLKLRSISPTNEATLQSRGGRASTSDSAFSFFNESVDSPDWPTHSALNQPIFFQERLIRLLEASPKLLEVLEMAVNLSSDTRFTLRFYINMRRTFPEHATSPLVYARYNKDRTTYEWLRLDYLLLTLDPQVFCDAYGLP